MKFEVGRDERGSEFRIGGGTGTGTPDLRSDVVKLLTVLRLLSHARVMLQSKASTLSATIGPLVALVSAAITTPPS